MGKDLKGAMQPDDWRSQGLEGSAEAFGKPQEGRNDHISILIAVQCGN